MAKRRSKLSYYFHKYFLIPCKIIRIALIDTVRQDGVEHAGYLAFLSLLSLFPFLIFLISIIGILGASDIGAEIVKNILASAPKEVAQALKPRINEIILGPKQSFLTIAIIGVIWTASSSVEGCRTILNRAYRVAFPPPYILRRLISILEFFVIIFSIIASIVVFIVVPTILENLERTFSFHFKVNYNLIYLKSTTIFILITIATSLLYFALPNAKQRFTQTVPGSVVVVALWFALVKIFSFYLEHFHQFNFVYGSLAGIIISLMFFYLIALVFIFGAQVNYHFHRAYQVFLKKR